MSFIDGVIKSLVRGALKETFMAKGIYLDKPSGYVNQRLANLITDEKLLAWDENDFHKYKKMHPTLKAWILLKSDPLVSKQLIPSVETKINPIDDGRWQVFTPRSANITSDSANTLDSILLICQ